jgi:hypothetical protein
MDELMKCMGEVYELMRLIPVSDTAVDAMYAARVKMRKAFQIAEELKVKSDDSE